MFSCDFYRARIGDAPKKAPASLWLCVDIFGPWTDRKESKTEGGAHSRSLTPTGPQELSLGWYWRRRLTHNCLKTGTKFWRRERDSKTPSQISKLRIPKTIWSPVTPGNPVAVTGAVTGNPSLQLSSLESSGRSTSRAVAHWWEAWTREARRDIPQ
jgi:hypothetical protein